MGRRPIMRRPEVSPADAPRGYTSRGELTIGPEDTGADGATPLDTSPASAASGSTRRNGVGGAEPERAGRDGAARGGAPDGPAPHGEAPQGDAPHGDAPHGDAPHREASARRLGEEDAMVTPTVVGPGAAATKGVVAPAAVVPPGHLAPAGGVDDAPEPELVPG
ncbi:hypothetical protein MXD58_024350, partial [Frankia sp. AgKG'84/4]|nr:hypothetical protein [Frankia sp. AgKG'84/4]